MTTMLETLRDNATAQPDTIPATVSEDIYLANADTNLNKAQDLYEQRATADQIVRFAHAQAALAQAAATGRLADAMERLADVYRRA